MGPILTTAELLEACASPWGLEGFSPVQEHPYLLADLRQPASHTDADILASAIARLPCPTLAIVPAARHQPALAGAFDVLADDEADLPAVVRNIEAWPLAAATLVQVLRHNERVGIEDGLLAESLAYGTLQAGAEFHRFLAGRQPPVRNDDAEPVIVERQGDLLRIVLNRPARRNAYSAGMRDALWEALGLLAADTSLACAEIRGAGDCFCVGGDLEEFGLASDPARSHAIRMARPVGLRLARLADRVECRVHRTCIGSGIELPAFAGRVVATADTYFQLPEITMGLIPGAGGTVGILRRIGRQRLAWWALSARRLRADTALAWGLIDAIT